MIPQPLIDRTKNNLEKLAKAMPGKFWFYNNNFFMKDSLLCWITPRHIFDVLPDTQQEFSNSIGRIAWEAFKVVIEINREITENDFNREVVIYPRWFKWTDGIFEELFFQYDLKEFNYAHELSAQLEALNILIEQDIK